MNLLSNLWLILFLIADCLLIGASGMVVMLKSYEKKPLGYQLFLTFVLGFGAARIVVELLERLN